MPGFGIAGLRPGTSMLVGFFARSRAAMSPTSRILRAETWELDLLRALAGVDSSIVLASWIRSDTFMLVLDSSYPGRHCCRTAAHVCFRLRPRRVSASVEASRRVRLCCISFWPSAH
ncbi:unnamed protein product [Symbiodinium sp. CCMP2592]|nr:unnamed protein product [Symbiodinium sp. CCMP2592]CAE7294024.1 unnamed protein product [Symbiodinium sp. CCMP2592]